jgi:N-acetylglucosamine-6-phosphate deacetylase
MIYLDRNDIINRIKHCIQKITRLNPDNIHNDKNLKNEYGLDSLDFMTLRSEVEDSFNIVFDVNNLAHMMTVNEIANQIEIIGDIKMKKIALLNGIVAFEEKMNIATILCEDGAISNIITDNVGNKIIDSDYETIECSGKYVFPGFIDLHVHGGRGRDSAEANEEAYQEIAKTQVENGTTSFLVAISGGIPDSDIHACMGIIKKLSNGTHGANILGAHIEGPFINPAKRAAIPKENLSNPSIEKALSVFGEYKSFFKIMTLASELPESDVLIKFLKENSIIVGLGHSDASFDNTTEAVKNGATHFTHTFNAMSLLTSRDPGMLGVALFNDKCYTEIIADGYHVHPENIKILFKIKQHDKICLVTDAISVVGTNATSFSLPGLENIQVHDGRTWGPNGAIIGSILTQNTAVKNIYNWLEIPLHEIVAMASKNPAVELGIYPKKGTILQGSDADITILNKDFEVEATIVNGRILYQK